MNITLHTNFVTWFLMSRRVGRPLGCVWMWMWMYGPVHCLDWPHSQIVRKKEYRLAALGTIAETKNNASRSLGRERKVFRVPLMTIIIILWLFEEKGQTIFMFWKWYTLSEWPTSTLTEGRYLFLHSLPHLQCDMNPIQLYKLDIGYTPKYGEWEREGERKVSE